MSKNLTDTKVVLTTLGVSGADATFNLIVGLLSGSTVMLAQALQGITDFITASFLYVGVKRSRRKADLEYQFGYGREIFFWVMVSGFLMFLGAGGLSVYMGYRQIVHPEPIDRLPLAFLSLTFALITNVYALTLSIRRLHASDKKSSWRRQLVRSSIVETKATLLIDFTGSVAATFGFIALIIYATTGNELFDGLGSIAIGLALMVASALLIRDVRDFLIGRSVDHTVAKQIKRTAVSVDGISAVLDLRTMYLGSNKLLVIIEVHVQDGLDTDQIEAIMDKVKQKVQARIPEVHHIQVEVETPDDDFL
jgi:cation diffusion facilitator family transporter